MEEEMKKKLGIVAEEQERYVDEDEKVEKFFAIIRRLRDARNCSTNSLREFEACKRMKKAKKGHVPVWTPSFQLEDFAGLNLAETIQPSSSNKEQEKEKKEGLDLNLTL